MGFAKANHSPRGRRLPEGAKASLKAGIDGLSDALQVDDSRFVIELRLVKDRISGHVLATVEAI